ncbi:tetratricopeptide repeat protein [bacterium]|nr:tetratricopeptide repeat protein [bacterium]
MARQQKKLSKQELREDPLMKSVAQTQVWLEQNSKWLAIGVAAVVAVVIISVMMINSRHAANAESMAELASVRQTLTNQPDADVTEQLDDVATTYKGTSGGAEALIAIADLALNDGDNEKALEAYERFIKEYPSSYMLTAAAYEGKATALSNLEQYEEAAEVYDRVLRMDDATHVKANLLLKAARCYEKDGQLEEALKRVDQALETEPTASVKTEADVLKARLELEG